MLNNKFPFSKSFLIFVALFAFASIAAYFAVIKKYPPTPVQPVIPSTPAIDTSDWKTYRNKDIGIEFKYPSILEVPEVLQTDNTNKKPENVFAGKKIDIYFKEANYIWFSFVGYTSDYQSFKDFFIFRGNDNINEECPNSFVYNNKGEACKIIEVAGNKAIWKNYFNEDECSPIFKSQIYFNNKSSSIYKGLSFMFNFEDAEKKVTDLYSCINDKAMEQSYLEAVIQSKNIMERKNLSNNDFQKINLMDQILSTFKFIK